MIDYCKTCVHDVDRADHCDNCYYCDILNDRGIAPTGYEEAKKQTNADKIRAMSDEELATFLYHAWNNASWCMVKDHCPDEDSCFPCWLDWLKQECE